MNRYFLFAVLFGLLNCTNFSCRKDNSFVIVEQETAPSKTFANVDPGLWPFFETFEREAAQRGISIDIEARGITGEIRQISGEHVAGQCNYNSQAPNHIIIDREFWEAGSDLYLEFIIFHELGHCYMYRDHREDSYTDGSCVSLMRSGLGDCRDNYHSYTRTKYLDELFFPNRF